MTDDPPSQLPAKVYYGMANKWDCDEMGHLNVRFYVRKASEATAALLLQVGLGPRHLAQSGVDIRLTDHHVRYLRELLPGTAVCGRAGFAEVTDTGGVIAVELAPPNSAMPSASFLARFRIEKEGTAMGWPEGTRERAAGLLVDPLPAHVGPRSVEFGPQGPNPTLEEARRFNLQTVSQCVMQADQFDPSGRLYTEHYIGLIADGVPHFAGLHRSKSANKDSPAKLGGAALEYRLSYRSSPQPGDVVAVMTGPRAMGEKTFNFVHWAFNLETGECLASSENIGISLDLETRKAVPMPEARRAALRPHLQPGLWV